MIEFLAAAFAIGFLGSLHCVGMCGGLVGAMTMSRPNIWWPGVITYQIGRLTTYIALGVIAGLIGSAFAHNTALAEAQGALSIFAGGLIIILALHIAGWLPDPFVRLSQGISKTTGLAKWIASAATSDSPAPWYTVGLLNGLLPCGLVYAALGLALTAPGVIPGAATMLVFGLGTVPAMMAAPALMRALSPQMRGKALKAAAVILIGIGLFTIARGAGIGHHHTPDTNLPHQHMQHSQLSDEDLEDAFCIVPGADKEHTLTNLLSNGTTQD